MTISAYTGLPGHGKSYGAVENVIVPALKENRSIYTNIPMHHEVCEKRYGKKVIQFKIDDISSNSNWWKEVFEPGSIIIIDELWRLWPSGLKANNVRDQDKEFLAEHRHLVGENEHATEIIFVTQDLSQIASFARSLVETTYRVVKLSKLGLNKKYRVDVYFGPVTGVSPPASKREREIHGFFKNEIFELYRSHTKSVTGKAGDETRIDKRFNVLKGYWVKTTPILMIVLALTAWWGSSQFSKLYQPNKAEESTKSNHSEIKDTVLKIQNPPTVAPPKKKPFKFLSLAEKVTLSFNSGVWPKIDYRYKVTFKTTEATFSYEDMQRLGYSLEPINQCMVKIAGPDYEGFAMCPRPDEQRGWFEELTTLNAEGQRQ